MHELDKLFLHVFLPLRDRAQTIVQKTKKLYNNWDIAIAMPPMFPIYKVETLSYR